MSTSSFANYAQGITDALAPLFSAGLARLIHLRIEPRSALRGLIAGVLAFNDDAELHFREFIDATQAEPRLMYVYHFQNADGDLLFRYDNAVHRPALTQPEHKHTQNDVVVCPAPNFRQILDEILDLQR